MLQYLGERKESSGSERSGECKGEVKEREEK